MRTIREVWLKNLRDKIGEKPYLKGISKDSKIPYRSLQNILKGTIPQGPHLARLAAYLKLQTETELFLDPDLMPKSPASDDFSTRLRFIAWLAALNKDKFKDLVMLAKGVGFDSPGVLRDLNDSQKDSNNL